jgi:hypothetical protein
MARRMDLVSVQVTGLDKRMEKIVEIMSQNRVVMAARDQEQQERNNQGLYGVVVM